jgi:hypothetical protein
LVGALVLAGGVSVGRDGVPPMLKFCSSRGPTVLAGALVEAGGELGGLACCVLFCGTACPSAAEPNQGPTANASIPKRNPAFIRIHLCRESRGQRAPPSHAAE